MPHDYAELIVRLRTPAEPTTPYQSLGDLCREAATALARLSAPDSDEDVDRAAKAMHIGERPWEGCAEYYKNNIRRRARAALAAHRAGRGM